MSQRAKNHTSASPQRSPESRELAQPCSSGEVAARGAAPPPRTRARPLAVDLFSGAGGLTTGLAQAGFCVIGAVEVDQASADSYALNHPGTQLWVEDIRSVSGIDISKRLEISPGNLDLVAGCPPCQGFSSLRTRNARRAADDERNDLIFDFARIVEQLLPRAVMLENVPRLEFDSRFQALRSRLQRDTHPRFPRESRKKRTVRDAIGGMPLAGYSGDPLHDLPERRSDRIRELIRLVPKDGGSRSAVPSRYLPPCHQDYAGYNDVFGRMAWDQIAPTITSGCHNPSRGRFLHPEHDRAITLREAALLQSFPRDYRFTLSRGKEQLAKQIGNALPPEMIRRIAKAFQRRSDKQP